MKLKKPLEFGEWVFYIGEEGVPDSQLLRIPLQGYASSKKHLLRAVASIFEAYASQGKPEYKDAALKEAAMMNLTYYDYLGKLVEHQICIRHGGSRGGKCNSSGFGDKLHALAEGIDSIVDKSPKLIQKAFEKVVKSTILDGKIIRPNTKPRLGGCSSCGGKRAFSKTGLNMGRAGRLQ